MAQDSLDPWKSAEVVSAYDDKPLPQEDPKDDPRLKGFRPFMEIFEEGKKLYKDVSTEQRADLAFDTYKSTYGEPPDIEHMRKVIPGISEEKLKSLYEVPEDKDTLDTPEVTEKAPKVTPEKVTPKKPTTVTGGEEFQNIEKELDRLHKKDYGTVDIETPEEKKQSTEDVSRISDYIKGFQELQAQDRQEFKDKYAEILKLRDNQMTQLQWQKLLGTFLNGLSQYAAAAYGEKHGIDMSGAKLSPDFDWKGRKEDIKSRIDLQIKQLKEETEQVRGDRRSTFHAGLTVIDMIRQEHIKARKLRVQQRELDLRLEGEKDSRLRQRLTQRRNAIIQSERDTQKRIDKLAKERRDEIRREEKELDNATAKIDKEYDKHKNEERALAEYIYAFRKQDYIDPRMATELIEDEGWLTEGKLTGRSIPDLIEWQTTYERIARDNPLTSERKIQAATYNVIKKRAAAEKRENSLLEVWDFLDQGK